MAGQLQDVRESRKMPWLKRGMQVEVNGKPGRVTGSGNGGNIRVRFAGENFSRNCHPHWQAVYFDCEGNIIADYRKATIREEHHERMQYAKRLLYPAIVRQLHTGVLRT